MGTPFWTNRLAMGTIPHSHKGKMIPKRLAIKILRNLFCGKSFCRSSSENKLLRIAEAKTPSKINGKDSIIMLKKIIFKLVRSVNVTLFNRLERFRFIIEYRDTTSTFEIVLLLTKDQILMCYYLDRSFRKMLCKYAEVGYRASLRIASFL
jgi:hypothetical protein